MRHPEQLARHPAVVRRGFRSLRGPLEQNLVVRAPVVERDEIGSRRDVRRVGVGVELAEARRAGLSELRVKGEALKASFGSARLDRVLPLRIVEIEIRRHGLAVVADRIEHSRHRVDEHAARARFVDQQVHARRRVLRVGDRREFDVVDLDDTLGRGNGGGERIVAASGPWRRRFCASASRTSLPALRRSTLALTLGRCRRCGRRILSKRRRYHQQRNCDYPSHVLHHFLQSSLRSV